MNNKKMLVLVFGVLTFCRGVFGAHAEAAATKGLVVVLDAGHGGKYMGCTGATGKLVEKNVVLEVVKEIAQRLSEQGVSVVLTRTTDVHLHDELLTDLQKRKDFTAKHKAAAFVSIHANSSPLLTRRGYEIYVPYEAVYPVQSYMLAACVHHMLSQKMDTHWTGNLGNLNAWDGGIHAANFNILRNHPCPAMLIEIDYLSNAAVEKQYLMHAHCAKVADAIAQGIKNYLATL